MRASTLVLVALVTLAAGCGTDEQAAGSEDGLVERTFLSQSVTGYDLVPGTSIRLVFGTGQVQATAGCNHLAGQLTSTADGVLTVSEMSTTDMGCDPERHDQDTWLAAFLTSGPRWSLDGDELRLSTTEAEVVLLDRVVADPDRALEGTRWVVDSLISGSDPDASVSSVPLDAEAHLRLDDGSFSGSTGCNPMSGTYRVDGDTIVVTAVAKTAVDCTDPEVEALEGAVTTVLNGPVRYEIVADRLTLRGSGGEGLGLHADE